MNKVRRKEISGVIEKLEDIRTKIEMIVSDEEEYFDNIPENLSCSERAEQSEEAIEALNEVLEKIDEITDTMEEIII